MTAVRTLLDLGPGGCLTVGADRLATCELDPDEAMRRALPAPLPPPTIAVAAPPRSLPAAAAMAIAMVLGWWLGLLMGTLP